MDSREHVEEIGVLVAANQDLHHRLGLAEERATDLADLLADLYPHVAWMRVTGHLALRQRDLWADAVDADWERAYAANPAAGLGTADRWWRR